MDRQVSFQALCHLLNHLQRISKKDLKKHKLQLYIDVSFLVCVVNSFFGPGVENAGSKFVPISPPSFTTYRERVAFGMKESRLADFYVDILGLAKNSHDAFILRSWEQQARNAKFDFAEAAFEVLKNRLASRPGDIKPMTVAQVNNLLDELHQSPDKKAVFQKFVTEMTAEEQRWIIRIILKTTKTGLGDAMILKCVHPDAQELYNMSSNLRKICDELQNPAKRFNLADGSLELFSPFQPMLADRESIDQALSHMLNGTAIVEPKLDGERMQIHYDGSVYRYWSRRGTEYTYLYGRAPSEGSLTPHIAYDLFEKSVQNVILDGEMLAYDPIGKDFLPFGTLKGVAESSGTESSFNKLHDPRPCFVVFDLVFLNDECLLSKPLRDRKALLHAHVKPVEGHLHIIEGTTITSQRELNEQMDLALANKLEGIIVKSPDSTYQVGKRSRTWIKLKPDYVDSLCDDLDLLIVGGTYGRGISGTPGGISSFLLALRDDSGRYKSICRVGSGLSIGELDRLRGRLGCHFVQFNPKHLPSWVDLPALGAERPDVILTHPSQSVVVQIKATQITLSDLYPAGYTLRHPRYIREREDRSWDSSMSMSDMHQLFKAELGSLAKRTIGSLPESKAAIKRTKMLRGKWAQVRTGADFSSLDASKVTRSQDVLSGTEVFVLSGEPGGLDKMDLEKTIVEAGGTITQAPVSGKTFCVISGKKDGLRLNNIRKQGNLDVLKVSWLIDSLEAGYRLPIQQRHIIFATEGTLKSATAAADIYGDSFTEDIKADELQKLLTRDNWPATETARTGTPTLIQEIKDRYLLDLN